jgi:hypothetical protein
VSAESVKHMATTLLRELWEGRTGIAEIRAMDVMGYMKQEFFQWPEEEEQLYEYVRRNDADHDIYYGVNLRTVRGGKASDVSPANNWVWADVDKKTGATFSSLLSAPIPQPQIIVDSGHGWHLYWKMATSLTHNEAQALMNDIADVVGGDRVGDPARILRLPGTFNRKAKPPLSVRVLRMLRLDHGWRKGDFSIPRSKVERRRIATVVGGGRGTRSEDLFKFAIDSLRKGMTPEDIYEAMLLLPAGSKLLEMRTEDRRRRWAKGTIDKARKMLT